MLKITPRQLEPFEPSAREDFEDRVLEHLWQTFPEQMAFAGDDRQRRMIVQDHIRIAWHQGFTREQDMVRYIDLMVLLGPDFDLDPRWRHVAAPIRAGKSGCLEEAYKALDEHPEGLAPEQEAAA